MNSRFVLKFVIKWVLGVSVLVLLILSLVEIQLDPEDSLGGVVPVPPVLRNPSKQLKPSDPDSDPEGWSDHDKNSRYIERFWDLVKKSKDPNHSLSTQPLFQSKSKLEYLWRPNNGQVALGPDESTRIVPQFVWGNDAVNASYADNFKTKTIVLWDGFKWWNQPWTDPKTLSLEDCKTTPNALTKCIFTQQTDNLESVHAVIATRDSFHTSKVPVPQHVLKFYFILESPFHSWAMFESYDLMATYWRGSDIVTPYARWLYYDLHEKFKKQDKNYAEGKSKPGAAFISNCNPWNDRVGFIQQLQKDIQIDVYGACGDGNHHCPRFGSDDCFGKLKRDYYFYFAFENSNCRDYVTEKLFVNGLSNDVIPIVMGAHPDDYKALAPERSYIHIDDFSSPKALAEYMKYLIQNPDEYNKYFEWKGTGEFIAVSFFCQVCSMMHYSDLVPPPKRSKPFRWGPAQAVQRRMCLPKGLWYWNKDNDGTTRENEKEKVATTTENEVSGENDKFGLNQLYGT